MLPTVVRVDEVVRKDDDDTGDELVPDKDEGWSAEPGVA